MDQKGSNITGNSKRFLVIYDGDCGICCRSIDFLRSKDLSCLFDFKAYQSLAENLRLDIYTKTVVLKDNRFAIDYMRSSAILNIFKQLGGIYKIIGYSFDFLIFRLFFDPVYNLIAGNRSFISRALGLNSCKIDLTKDRARGNHQKFPFF